MESRRIWCLLVTVAIAGSVNAKDKQRDWQNGKMLDTERTRHYVGTSGSSKTSGTVDIGERGSGKIDTETRTDETPMYKVYQTYAIETADRVYIVQERIRWVWSKAANLEVNGPVRYAVEGDTAYILDRQGKEHKTSIVKTIIKTSLPSPAAGGSAVPPPSEPSQIAKQPDFTTVVCKSTPDGAEITIDGKFVGTTPSTLRLAPGDHTVLLQKTGFKDWSRSLTVSESGDLNLDITLDRIQ